jgi:hypothetical protein
MTLVFPCALLWFCPLAALCNLPLLAVTRTPFSDYQPILDRMPFGPLPPNFGQVAAEPVQAQTSAQVLAEQQKLAQQINMSCINITPEGTSAIGFTDLGAKPPVSYYLLVGASGGGWTVVNADYDAEWAQIEKDGVTITLKLGKGLIDAPPAPAAVAQVAAPALPAPVAPSAVPEPSGSISSGSLRRPSQPGIIPTPGVSAMQRTKLEQAREEVIKLRESGGDIKSYVERLRERAEREKMEKTAIEEASREQLQNLARKITESELKKRERELNLNLIEQGAKPISDIELTPEEEAAFIAKGVLAQ